MIDPANSLSPQLNVEVVTFSLREQRLQVFITQRQLGPFQGSWVLPGGYVGINESLEEAALRELKAATGLTQVYLEQLYTYGEPDRDPRSRMISIVYYVLIPADAPIHYESIQKNLPPVGSRSRTYLTWPLTTSRSSIMHTDGCVTNWNTAQPGLSCYQ